MGRPWQFWALWGLLGLAIGAVVILTGCGTDQQFNAASAAPTPAALPFETPCLPPVTPGPGQSVSGVTYVVWSNDCTRVERTTSYTLSEPAGLSIPTPAVACVVVAAVTPRPCP